MMLSYRSKLVVLLLLLLPQLSLAEGEGLGGISASFTPSITDMSVRYLGQIFGTVGTVLHGTSGQLLGEVFKIFNYGLLVVAGIFLIYTIIMTVVHTAHEGEFMGRKWNTAWIAIRTVLGLGLLVPSPITGYSIIQVIVMWVVLQGIGFANLVWVNALSYLVQGGRVYTPPSTEVYNMVNLAGTLLEMQVCMYKAQEVSQRSIENQKNAQEAQQTATGGSVTATPSTGNFVQNFSPYFAKITQPDGGTIGYVRFPGSRYQTDGQQDNKCGQIEIGKVGTDTIIAAIQQMVIGLDTYAKKIATEQTTATSFADQVRSAIVGAAADWINITLPLRTKRSLETFVAVITLVNYAQHEGWITAGQYYYTLGNIQDSISEASKVEVTISNAPAGMTTSNKSGDYFTFAPVAPFVDVNKIKTILGFSETDAKSLANMMVSDTGKTEKGQINPNSVAGHVINALAIVKQMEETGNYQHVTIPPLSVGVEVVDRVLNLVTSGLITAVNNAINSLIASFNSQIDPIIVVRSMGKLFMLGATLAWLTGTFVVFGTGLSSSLFASTNPLPYAIQDALMTFIPAFTILCITFFTLGATFAYYVPLIPFIIFFFAAVGWFIAVIEAMIAAPLVALGIAHPEGQHDLWGRSEHAVMYLLSVFLRPVLMIIGLVVAMILSRVALRFLNAGFFGIVISLSVIDIFSFLAILVVYCVILVSLITQVFSLIFQVPDRVMRWLGVQEAPTGGVMEALGEAKRGYEVVPSAMAEAGKQITTKAWEGETGRMREKQRAQKKTRGGGGP
jgi:defect in organelle trafficking protein DotA